MRLNHFVFLSFVVTTYGLTLRFMNMWRNMPLYALAWVFLMQFQELYSCVLIDLSFVEIDFNYSLRSKL